MDTPQSSALQRTWNRELSAFEELPLASPDGDELLIEVDAAAVVPAEWRQTGPYLGRSAVGVVVAHGEAASEFAGARIAVGPLHPCGECDRCRRGVVEHCLSGFELGGTRPGTVASHVVARARWVCRLDQGLEIEGPGAAAVAGPAATAYALYSRANIGPGDAALVIGTGALGALVEQIARAKGARPFSLAADRAAGDASQELSGAALGERPWRLLETSGSASGRQLAATLANPGATVACIAGREVGAPDAPLSLGPALDRSATFIGVGGAHPDLYPEVAALVVRGDLDLTPVIAEVAATDLRAPGDDSRITIVSP